MLRYSLTALATLLVVVDPFGILPIFISLTRHRSAAERAALATRAALIGFGVSLLFLVAGQAALAYLGVTVPAFSISGGILLFATAVSMLLGHRAPLQSAEAEESGPDDLAIFPLAIPLLAGPGTITSILLLTAQARGDLGKLGALAGALALVFLLTRVVLHFATEPLLRRVGPGGLQVATRLMGILLAALAVQFVLNGVTDYVRALQAARL